MSVEVPKDFAEAQAMRDRLEQASADASAVMQTFSRGAMGLTPDHIKATPEWREANQNATRTFAALRAFNAVYVKRFAKEIRAQRDARHAARSMKESPMNAIDTAEAAGAQYAQDQLESDYFHDWVHQQMVEADQMRRRDPASVIDDPREVARNMLQQLKWDIHRDMDQGEILRLIDTDDGQRHPGVRELVTAFFSGLDGVLRSKDTRSWLADQITEIGGEVKGGRGGMGEASAARGPYIVHVITHGGPPTSHAPAQQFASIRAARAHGAALDRTAPTSAEISIGDQRGNKLEILNRRSGQWHVQRGASEARESAQVRDYIAVDSRGRRVAGPFTDYGKARKEAERSGGFVQWANEVRSTRSPSASPLSGARKDARDEAIRRAANMARRSRLDHSVWMDANGDFQVDPTSAAPWTETIVVARGGSGHLTYKPHGEGFEESRQLQEREDPRDLGYDPDIRSEPRNFPELRRLNASPPARPRARSRRRGR